MTPTVGTIISSIIINPHFTGEETEAPREHLVFSQLAWAGI